MAFSSRPPRSVGGAGRSRARRCARSDRTVTEGKSSRFRPEGEFVQAVLALKSRLECGELSWPEYQAVFMALVRDDRERRAN